VPKYREQYQHLYDIPIDRWGLSFKAYGSLRKMDIQSVGDIIDLYHRLPVSLATPPFGEIIQGEVKDKLIDADYWKYVENYPLND